MENYDVDFHTLLDFTPAAEVQHATEQVKTSTSELERFWAIAGNWGEFGLYFGLGLGASLLVRAIPVLQPGAVILAPAIGAGLGLLAIAAPDRRIWFGVLAIAFTAAILGGNWDAWTAWVFANAWKIGATAAIGTGVLIYLISSITEGKKNG